MDFFNNDELNKIREYAKENHIPIMLNNTARFLIKTIKENKPKNVLEIGTAIGYSGIAMLNSLEDLNLKTVELSEDRFKLAVENFNKFGFANRAEALNEDALKTLTALIRNQEKFDFIFLDGPKSHYKDYINNLIEMLNKNGMIFCDNVLFQNMVLSNIEPPKKHRTIVRNLREFIRIIQENNKLNVQIIDVEDGVALIKKIN